MNKQNNTAFNISEDRVFRAMKIAESSDSYRYNLSGVHIEPIEGGGSWIVATDGHIMLVQRDRKADVKEAAILRFQAPQLQLREDDEGFTERDWIWGGSKISVPELTSSQTVAAPVAVKGSDPWLHVLVERIDGNFVDWRKPLDQSEPPQDTCFNGELDGINVSLLHRLCGPHHGSQGIQIHGSFSDSKPLLVTFGSDPDSFGAICKRKLSLTTSPLNDLLTAINMKYEAMQDQQFDRAIIALDRITRLKGDEVQCFHEAHRIATTALSELNNIGNRTPIKDPPAPP